jgi:hypothetical protein
MPDTTATASPGLDGPLTGGVQPSLQPAPGKAARPIFLAQQGDSRENIA